MLIAYAAVPAPSAIQGWSATDSPATISSRMSRLPSTTSSGRRPLGGTSKTWKGLRTARWTSGHANTVAPMISVRNSREGSSHSHRPSPATIAASTIRSRRSSSSAPRFDVRHCRRAVSPSTPSSIDAAWTKTPPTTAREAESDQAAHSPTSAVKIENTAGGIRAAEMAMVMRVEMGRFSHRETGPSLRFASECRTRCLARRRSSGVSMSCHQPSEGRRTAWMGTERPIVVTAAASEWSPAAEDLR